MYIKKNIKTSDEVDFILKFCAAYIKENTRSKDNNKNSIITDGVLTTLLNKNATKRKVNVILSVFR